ncbi:MAG: hypothetical protein ACO3RV_08505, partial [Luteolibacter sp.]
VQPVDDYRTPARHRWRRLLHVVEHAAKPPISVSGLGGKPRFSPEKLVPGITGEIMSEDGLIRVNPTGRVEIVVEPRSSK